MNSPCLLIVRISERSIVGKLDEVFASDVVGDGSTGIMGPFEAAQTVPYRSGEPSVVGAFGDVNEALEKVLKQGAKAAAAGTDGLTISPLIINTDRKGGVFHRFLDNSELDNGK